MMPSYTVASWNAHSSVRLIRLMLMNNKSSNQLRRILLTIVNRRDELYQVWQQSESQNTKKWLRIHRETAGEKAEVSIVKAEYKDCKFCVIIEPARDEVTT